MLSNQEVVELTRHPLESGYKLFLGNLLVSPATKQTRHTVCKAIGMVPERVMIELLRKSRVM